MRARSLLALLLGLVTAACRDQAGPGAEKKEDAAPKTATAEGAFCKEHGVLEAVCTKCNPALIPVFKAKGDWCEEHGFPESFCPICHPERGGRPSAEVKDDGAPPDGTKVSFKTKETARLAGIEVARAAERPSRAQIVVTAKIVYDAAKVAEVNARSTGVVRAIRADVGTKVRAGSPLATIESAEVGAVEARVQAARSRVQVAAANYARLKKLHEEGIAAEKDALAARQELDAAKADLAAAQSAVGMVGGVVDGASRYTLTAPIPGVVTQRNATIGRLVHTEEVLFEIVDTSSMWAEVDIPETEVPRVVVGQPVALSVEGLGEREFSGTLGYVAPWIDPQTRTAKGRVALDNPDGVLRGNMFARARIAVTASGKAVVVPRKAVQRAKNTHLVFVRLAEDVFEARRVALGPGDNEFIEVSGRVKPGDPVACDGSFLLKTETLKGSIGAGCCEAEEPK
ncbi:MAG: efflux RND transporter periplasmic adaptor subunit [Deltaproteobacteria bacterium]|nr:efflux RND transporter periplasmic adaptor subunit [Deltaproteobacteria bacterium]